MVQSRHLGCAQVIQVSEAIRSSDTRWQIIGSLVFRDAFGGFASGEFYGETGAVRNSMAGSSALTEKDPGVEHLGIATMMKSLTKGALGGCLTRFPPS